MNTIYNILDFETTGLSADYDRVIEVGVVKVHNNEILETFQEFINPGINISNVITNITGITNAMVKNADNSKQVMTRLHRFLGDELIVAHNSSFDSRFFYAEMKRNNIKANNNFLCSLLLARRVYQELGSHKLGSLCKYLGIENKAAHRALGDAQATHEVFQNICLEIQTQSSKKELEYEYLSKLTKVAKKNVSKWILESNK